jgi:4-alpha-glucanotransferase
MLRKPLALGGQASLPAKDAFVASKENAARIAALGRLCGITPEYRDNFGRRHPTSPATYRALLTAMEVAWEDPERLDQELARRRLRPFASLLDPVQVVFPAAGPTRIFISPWLTAPEPPARLEVQAKLASESGERISWHALLPVPDCPKLRPVGQGFRLRLELPLPPLELGYYDLTLTVGTGSREESGRTRLIAAPVQVFLPDCLAADRRLWGLSLPLYALRSQGNWGMGDFADLQGLMPWAASLGAAFVGVNPLHAQAPRASHDPSPYAPTSRRFLNFEYLNLEMVPELASCPEAQALLAGRGWQQALRRLRAAKFVVYTEVCRRKDRVLRLLYQTFQALHGPPEAPRSPRGEEFVRFLAGAGEPLARFGQFSALAESFRQADWRRWPRDYQRPDSTAVAAFAREHPREVAFHQYVQWLAVGQLDEAAARARLQKLPFSLYQDLALSAHPGGFDTWASPGLFAQGAPMGAPPDAFNPKGQNWGLPPLIPERLRETGYRFFIDTLRANCPVDGILRLDHVMALFRLFWIPRGLPPAKGAYVIYPARELLGILALESRRRRTLIVGEDLGTVTPRIRRELSKTGVFSYRVFYFERQGEYAFKPPKAYPRRALAAVTTHDLPTLTGFWLGQDIALKGQLSLYPDPRMAAADAEARRQDRLGVTSALNRRGLLPPDTRPEVDPPFLCPEEVRFGVLEYLAQSSAALLEVRLEEIFGVPHQQNLPGTTREHPNWRRKLPLTLEAMQQSPEPQRLAPRLNRWRRREEGSKEMPGGGG